MLNSPIEEIKNRLDIVEVIGQYIKLQKAGVNYRAVCPFHSEKKPSFFVSPGRQIWHCFGCGKGGSIFNFVMEIEGVDFGDALRLLAQKAGVELKREDPKLQTERQRLYEICELAARFFEKQLAESKVGQEAKAYLLGRKISEGSIKKWRVGYAPDNWTGLSDFLVGQGYAREEIVKAGLAIQKESGTRSPEPGTCFDRFRGRIIFPIYDIQGYVVGFGGRVFKTEDLAKYVNTPNTLLYDKSSILYGLDKAKVDIRKKDECILVEGYIDVIMVSQAGYENVAATSGTALTPYQLKILKRYSENLLTAFDMDVAGDMATKRGIDLAQREGFNIKVIVMPEGRDPADIIAEDQLAFGQLLAEVRSIVDFYFESTFTKFDASNPEGKKHIAKVLLPVIKRIPNAIELAHWRQKLASALGVSEEDIELELKKTPATSYYDFYTQETGDNTQNGRPAVQTSTSKSRREVLEEHIVSIFLRWQEKIYLIEDHFLHLFSEPLRQILQSVKARDGLINSPQDPTVQFIGNASEAGIIKFADLSPQLRHLLLRAEAQEEEDEKEIEQEIIWALNELRQLEKRKNLQNLTKALREAEAVGDETVVREILQKFHSTAQES